MSQYQNQDSNSTSVPDAASGTEPTPDSGANVLTQMRCNVCHGQQHEKLFDAPGFDDCNEHFTLVRCQQCQLVSIAPLPTEEQLSPYYNTDYYGSADQKFTGPIEKWTRFTHQRLARRILKFIKQNSSNKVPQIPKVLDIGCGRASLLSALAELGCSCTGLERSDFPEHKDKNQVKIIYGDMADAELPAASFDAIVIWHVLEHLNSPHETLRMARKLLKPGGLLLIGVPNFGSFQSSLFRQHWWHLDLPRHLYHFTHHSLSTLLTESGFRVAKNDTFTIDQSIFGFIQSALNRLFPSHHNALFSALKPSAETGFRPFSMEILSAMLLTPLALLEYLLSGLLWNGSCLIYYAIVNQSDK